LNKKERTLKFVCKIREKFSKNNRKSAEISKKREKSTDLFGASVAKYYFCTRNPREELSTESSSRAFLKAACTRQMPYAPPFSLIKRNK